MNNRAFKLLLGSCKPPPFLMLPPRDQSIKDLNLYCSIIVHVNIEEEALSCTHTCTCICTSLSPRYLTLIDQPRPLPLTGARPAASALSAPHLHAHPTLPSNEHVSPNLTDRHKTCQKKKRTRSNAAFPAKQCIHFRVSDCLLPPPSPSLASQSFLQKILSIIVLRVSKPHPLFFL